MGLLGLRKFIDSQGCTRLLPVPLSEQEELELRERQSAMNAANGIYNDLGDEDGDGADVEARLTGDDTTGEGVDEHWQDALTSSTAIPSADHVLVDMNCIVHSCFGKHEVATKSKKEIIHDILERLRVLVTQVVTPRKTLTICLDGPAPIAKLHTQRLRRRKVSLLDTGAAHQLSSLSITAGSLFMVELENALAAQFRLNDGRGFLRRRCPVFLHGSTVVGEGEAKISRALSYLAYQHDLTADSRPAASSRGQSSSSASAAATPRNGRAFGRDGHRRNHRHAKHASSSPSSGGDGGGMAAGAPATAPYTAPYNPNDSVVVLGNDIDLVMTCLGATFYHNITVVGPSSLQVINVSEILYRWLKGTSATHGDAARILPSQLASVRIDFIFLFLLNGGDHYIGAGDVAMGLWKRYRTVRAAYPDHTLVSPSLTSINTEFLADLLSVDEYTGEAEPETGTHLFEAALWSLYTTVTGVCPDYRYVPPETAPHIGHLRAAALRCKKRHRTIAIHVIADSVPLTPLETYVALMPTEAALPAGVAQTLRLPKQHQLAQTLQTSNDAAQIAKCAEEAVRASEAALTVSERYLRQFTAPVQLNVMPPAPRLSRHAQHRMVAKQGEVTLPQAMPVVQRTEMPAVGEIAAAGGYSNLEYPTHTQKLYFTTPFDLTEERAAPGDVQRGFSPSSPSATSSATGARTRQPTKFIRLRPAAGGQGDEEAAVADQVQKTLNETAMLRQQGKKLYSHRFKTMNRRLHRMQLNDHKRMAEEADKDKRLYALPHNGEAQESFLQTLQQFLGDDMKAEELVEADGIAAEVRQRRRHERQARKALKIAAKKAAPKPVKRKGRNKNKSARLRKRAAAEAAAAAKAKEAVQKTKGKKKASPKTTTTRAVPTTTTKKKVNGMTKAKAKKRARE